MITSIEIKDNNSLYVLEDGVFVCQHLNTTIESVDCGYPNRHICDWVDDWQEREVCTNCDYVLETEL